MRVRMIYNQLFKKYGPQGWWPAYVPTKSELRRGKPLQNSPSPCRRGAGARLDEPARRARRGEVSRTGWSHFRDPAFEIAVGAILTQNTAWKNVARAIENLYNAKALTPARILKLPTRKLQTLIRPAGYFRQKTRKLKLFSRWLVEEFGGDILKLKRLEIEDVRYKLLEQWGIGPETADSIILYALNKPIFVIDEYTRRLCKKHGVVYNTYDEYQKFFESKLPNNTELFQEFHALIVQCGKDNNNVTI